MVTTKRPEEQEEQRPNRRFFLQTGLTAAATVGLLATGCNKMDDPAPKSASTAAGVNPDGSISLGSGDVGILNYAYALEQLEAAFYTAILQNPYAGMTQMEMQLLTDIRDHEINHREFFKAALGNAAIPELQFTLGSLDLNDRLKVLRQARRLEDVGVGAYNGAGELIENPAYLLIAGKIVSVEARHAALIRDLIENGSFADMSIVNAQGLDQARSPMAVLSEAQGFIVQKIDASGLPAYA